MPSIQATVQLGVDASMAEMRREINEQNVKLVKMESDNCKLAGEMKMLRSQEHTMLNEVKNLRTHLDEQDIFGRIDNLVVYGLPESYAEVAGKSTTTPSDEVTPGTQKNNADLEWCFLKFCRDRLHFAVRCKDISVVHFLPGKSTNQRPSPLLMRFNNRKAQGLVLSAKKKLREDRSCKIYVNEHLTKSVNQLFTRARSLLKDHWLAGAWTRNGHLLVKTLKSQGSKIITIKTEQDLMLYA